MGKRLHRTISVVLAVLMIVAMLPTQVFATDGGASIVLPISEAGDDEALPSAGMTKRGLARQTATPVYLSAGAASVSLPEIPTPDDITSGAEGARIQALDDGDKVVAQTAVFSIGSWQSVIYSKTLFLLDLLEEGSYPLQLVYGDVQNPATVSLDYALAVVDAPVLVSGYVYDLTAGLSPFEVNLTMTGFDGNAANLSFSLIDTNAGDAEIDCNARHVLTSAYGGFGASRIEYIVTPSSEIIYGHSYALKITAASGELYSNARSISTTADEASPSEIAVLEITPDEAVPGQLVVKVGGVDEDTDYTVTVAIGDYSDSQNYVYSGKLEPAVTSGVGVFTLLLTRNGLPLPLSAYGNTTFWVRVSDDEGNSDYDSYYHQEDFSYQNTSLTLGKTDENRYAFSLTGKNMLLDLYENENLSFTLKKYVSGQGYTQVGSTSETIHKETATDSQGPSYTFSGSITTTESLSDATSYSLYYGDNRIAQTSKIGGSTAAKLGIRGLRMANFDHNSKLFYLNFGQFPLEATLTDSGEKAVAQLFDLTAGAVVAQSGEVSGAFNDAGYREFSFSIPTPTAALDAGHSYMLQFESGGQTVTGADFSTSYASMGYDAAQELPDYISVNEPVFAGDTALGIRISSSSIKNVPVDHYMNEPIEIISDASDLSLTYTSAAARYEEYEWIVTLTLSQPIAFGSYRLTDYDTFTAIPVGSVVLGQASADSFTKTVSIRDCHNLPSAAYTAVLYDTSENGYGKLGDLSLAQKDGNTLIVTGGLPANIPNGSYTLEVFAGGKQIGSSHLYIGWNYEEAGCVIRGYRIANNRYEEISYLTDSDELYLYTSNPNYAYVRYCESAGFEGASYAPIRQHYDQRLTLTAGDGPKTIYVQFKTTGGAESPVYTWTCRKVAEIAQPAIVNAKLTVSGEEAFIIPESTEFTVSLISTSQLADARVKFWDEKAGSYNSPYSLVYKGAVPEGYLFEGTFNSSDSPFRWSWSDYDWNNFTAVSCELTDLLGNTEYDALEIPISFRALTNIALSAWGSYGGAVYTNQNTFTVRGYASPGALVTVDAGGVPYPTTSGAGGAFAVSLTGLEPGIYRITAQDSKGLVTKSAHHNLIVDQTKPVIDTLKATLDASNVILSWTSADSDIAYYLLWKDDAALIRASDGYTAKSYLTPGGVGSTFKVVAVDAAGNWSEPKTVTVGDTEPPTKPGAPTMTKHGTKQISFGWTASTDNVAVYQYKIYRDKALIATVGYGTLSYIDTGLSENTVYEYEVYAFDRAENQSEAAEASLSTAALIISDSTSFSAEYVKEEQPLGVDVSLTLDQTDSYYSIDGVITKLQYKLQTAETWSELALTGILGTKRGTWVIEDLPVGAYTLRFYAVDSEGTEKTTAEAAVQVSHDTTPPTVWIEAPVSAAVLSGKSLVISGRSSDNVEVSRVELSYSLDGGANYTAITTLTNEQTYGRGFYFWSHTFDATKLPSGQVTLKAVAYDARENQAQATMTFTLDNTPPEPPYGFRISCTGEYIGVLWSYPDQEVGSDFSKFRVYRALSADGVYTKVFEDASIGFYDTQAKGISANTYYYYYVTAVDLRGNESEPTAVLSGIMEVDVTPPTIASYLPRQNAVLCNTAAISVSLYDNSMLKQLAIGYRKPGAESWIDLATIPADKNSVVLSYTWDVSALESGSYEVRLIAEDLAGSTSEQVIAYAVKAYTPPTAPTGVSAAPAGHREIALAWSYTGDASLLSGFRVLRKGLADSGYALVKYIKDAAAVSYTDQGLTIGAQYSYQIEAVDQWDARAISEAVLATAPSGDTEDPAACIAALNLVVAKDREITLSGCGSTDNDEIALYAWDFGDAGTATGETVTHTYTTAGTYTVTLTVTDQVGNTGTDTVTLEVVDLAEAEGLREVTLHVVDASTTDALPGAEVRIRSTADETDSEGVVLVTNGSGQASVILKDGSYSAQTVCSDYLLRTNSITVSEDSDTDITVGMSRSNLLIGSLTATEMTYEEIEAAGIDPDDPDNQHVFRFAVVLEFEPVEHLKYKIPINFFSNPRGAILGYGSGWGAGGGFHFADGGWSLTVYPISKDVYLVIYGEAHWLKEMFHVQLLLANSSATDYIEDAAAELTLPEGLSLATMRATAASRNTAVQTLNGTGTIPERGSAVADWYVRGDTEGEYNLTASVRGTFMPNPEPFSVTYKTAKPIRVWAGSALHLYIEAESSAMAGQDYRVIFRLENTSDKDLYKVKLNIFGGKFFDEYDVSDLEYAGNGSDLSGVWADGTGALERDVLKPGETMEGVFKIVFEGDMIEDDVRYMLKNMFVHTMEGSTTEIGTTLSLINHEDTAIIVIPGIMGSELLSDGKKVWPPETLDYALTAYLNNDYASLVRYLVYDLIALQVTADADELTLKGFFQRKLEELAEALTALHAGKDDMGDISVYAPSSDQYGTAFTSYQMVESMKTYTENTYLFSYDWRDDNDKAAQKLDDFINRLLEENEKIEKVVIVAHSMGGLVTSAYEKRYEGTPGGSPVDTIVTVGTPYLGTPEAVAQMVFFEGLDNETIAAAVTGAATILSGADIDFTLSEDKILELIRDELIDEYAKPVSVGQRYAEILELVESMKIQSLTHYFQGFYQLLPSESYGDYMYDKDARPLPFADTRQANTTYDNLYWIDHVQEQIKGNNFHNRLNELTSQILLNSEKAYFIVGHGQETAGKITLDRYYNVSDVDILSGDGTVTFSSATMNGKLPADRSFYHKQKHTPLFADAFTVNTIKDILYKDLYSQSGAEESVAPSMALDPYKKIKVECPVDAVISKGGEMLSSIPLTQSNLSSFGRLYLIGKNLDTKVFFVDDDRYDVELLGNDTGKMTLTVEFYSGVENEKPTASYVFSDVPVDSETRIELADASSSELGSTGVMKLLVDRDGDGVTDSEILPDSGKNGGDKPTTGGTGGGKPSVEHNDGGSVTIKDDGKFEIVPDEGYVVKEIYVNGQLADEEALKNLKPTDIVKVVFEKASEWVNPYRDVKETDWFYGAVKYATQNSLMIGTGEGLFEPNITLSRAMLVTILWRIEGEPEPLGKNPFTDLAQDWYLKAVVWANENNIVTGYGDGVFAPADGLTREQMAAILYRYSRHKGYDISDASALPGYTDTGKISGWALDAMKWANAKGLISGRTATTLAPDGTSTRAETATVLRRYLEAYPPKR